MLQKPKTKKPYLFAFLIIGAFGFGCGSGYAWLTEFASGSADVALELTVPDLIQNSLASNPQAADSWKLVADSIDNQLLPLINAGVISTGDLKAWFNQFKLGISGKPIPQKVIMAIKKIGDRFLRLIPTDHLGKLIDSNPVSKEIIAVLRSAIISFRDIIHSEIGTVSSRSLG